MIKIPKFVYILYECPKPLSFSKVAQNGVGMHDSGEGEASAAAAKKEAAEWEKKYQVILQEKDAM